MIISFFEEFPTQKNLAKLNLIHFPAKLYLAAKSLKEFNALRSSIKHHSVKEVIYWPILEKKEGYWISPFSDRKALQRIFQELQEYKNKGQKQTPVMLDLELPTRHNPWLYLLQFFNFHDNKKMIKQFILNHPQPVYLAEYYPCGKIKEKLFQLLGLHYNNTKTNPKNPKIIKMAYHSLHHFNKKNFTKLLSQGKKQFQHDYLVAFGTIAKGIDENEPLLSKKQLQEDLSIAQKTGIEEVIIFRLGGLNQEYLSILKRHALTTRKQGKD